MTSRSGLGVDIQSHHAGLEQGQGGGETADAKPAPVAARRSDDSRNIRGKIPKLRKLPAQLRDNPTQWRKWTAEARGKNHAEPGQELRINCVTGDLIAARHAVGWKLCSKIGREDQRS